MTGGLHFRVIALLSMLVPRGRRDEWRREWEGELACVEQRPARRATRWQLFARACGAWPDALHLNLTHEMVEGCPSAPLYTTFVLALVFAPAPLFVWFSASLPVSDDVLMDAATNIVIVAMVASWVFLCKVLSQYALRRFLGIDGQEGRDR
jgi:hypothetical protein